MLNVEQIAHFLSSVLALVLALLVIASVVWLIRRGGYTGPIELSEFLERTFGFGHAEDRSLRVNVSFVDAQDHPMVFGPFIDVRMHNGHGNKYRLSGGTFEGCDPKSIRAGATVEVWYQDSPFTEKLRVRLNNTEQHLFLKSKYTFAEILNHIEGGGESEPAPAG